MNKGLLISVFTVSVVFGLAGLGTADTVQSPPRPSQSVSDAHHLTEALQSLGVSIRHLVEGHARAFQFKRVEFAATELRALRSDLEQLHEKRLSALRELALVRVRLEALTEDSDQGTLTPGSTGTAMRKQQAEQLYKLLSERLRALDRQIDALEEEVELAKRHRSILLEEQRRDEPSRPTSKPADPSTP